MDESKKPEDFGITNNSFNEQGLANAVKWLINKVNKQDEKIEQLINKNKN